MISLSYRREDSVAIAGRLYDRLQASFGREHVFMDFDSIPGGADFREHIDRTITQSHVVLALMALFGLPSETGRVASMIQTISSG